MRLRITFMIVDDNELLSDKLEKIELDGFSKLDTIYSGRMKYTTYVKEADFILLSYLDIQTALDNAGLPDNLDFIIESLK